MGALTVSVPACTSILVYVAVVDKVVVVLTTSARDDASRIAVNKRHKELNIDTRFSHTSREAMPETIQAA